MSRRSTDSFHFLIYCRAFLITLSILFFALVGVVWWMEGDTRSQWPFSAWVAFCLLAVSGILFLLVALLAPRKWVIKLADGASSNEASIIVMIVAAPLYFVLKWFVRRK